MNAPGRVLVYIATSFDGFIAGPDDDLSWLHPVGGGGGDASSEAGGVTYDEFMKDIGALLMGRRTYEVVRSFDMPWPYGELPVLVATHRPLDDDVPGTVRAVEGTIGEMVEEAREAAGGLGVYLDGGELIRQAAEEDLIDELIVTIAPIALGRGLPLFAGMTRRYPLEILSHESFPGGMVQMRMRPRRD